MGAYSEPRHDGGGIASRSHREQQRTATSVAPVVCSTRGGGFGSQKAIDLRGAAFARTTPMADDQHTSMAFVAPHVASKYNLLPHPPAFQPHFHSCQTALPLALHTLQNPSIWTTIFLLTIANASQLANRIVSQHTTPHRALSTLPGLILLMSAGLPFFALVHSLVVIC